MRSGIVMAGKDGEPTCIVCSGTISTGHKADCPFHGNVLPPFDESTVKAAAALESFEEFEQRTKGAIL